MIWTDERSNEAAKMWADGLSATQIAQELKNGISRNAVIGRIHRMGLNKAPRKVNGSIVVRSRPKRALRPKAIETRRANVLRWGNGKLLEVPSIEIEMPVIAEPPLNISFIDLQQAHCRWVVSDGPALFCGHTAPEGSSWCPAHRRIVYTPRTEKRAVNKPVPMRAWA